MAEVTFNGICVHLEWINPATKEVSYAKGSLDAFYWERGFDGDVMIWSTAAAAKAFADKRVTVPYRIGQGEPR